MIALTIFLVTFTGCASTAAPTPTAAITPSNATPAKVPAPTASDEAWAATIQAAQKNESRITIYSYSMVGDVGLAISKAFKERYGITLEIIAGTAPIGVERIRTEYRVGQHAMDIFESAAIGTHWIVDLGVSGLDLPVFRERDVWLFPPNAWDNQGRELLTYLGPMTPFVHTGLVRAEEEPSSWYDLLDPKWKEQIIVGDPRTTSTMDLFNVALVSKGMVKADYFQRLAKQKVRFSAGGARGPLEALARKEGKVALSSTGSALYLIQAGAPIKAITPKEGTVSSGFAIIILNKAPHPNAAKVFVNWLFTQDGASIYAKAIGGSSVRKGVQDFTPDNAKVNPERIQLYTPEESERATADYSAGVMFKLLAQ